MKTFFNGDDYRFYLDLVAEAKSKMGVSVWAYCLMPNHVHLVVVPEYKDSLARLFRFVHRHYSRRINFRENWKGHLWQERFHSFVMDERYLLATVRYAELNPVRARLCAAPTDWPWSSARAHYAACDDAVVSVQPMLERVADWEAYLLLEHREEETDSIRRHAGTGRPAGDEHFVAQLEALTGCELRKKKPGPKPKVR
jgi:putative transposase